MKSISFCLTREEIGFIVRNADDLDALCTAQSNASILVEGARNFDHQLVSLSYLLAKVLENVAKQESDVKRALKCYYLLSNEIWLFHQEMRRDFIDYVMRSFSVTSRNAELDEKMIQLQEDYADFINPKLRG